MYDRPQMPLPGQQPDRKVSKINSLVSKFKKMSTHHDNHEQNFHSQQVFSQQSSNTFQSSSDIFSNSISTDAPLSIFSKTTHPVSVPSTVDNNSLPIATNKFYGNLLLDSQTLPAWTHPYSVWFSKDTGYEGLAVHQVPASDRVFGPDASANPVEYFFGPTGVKSIVLGSSDFDSSATLGLENIKHLSTDVKIQSKSNGYLTVPLIQGQAFVTGIYYNLIPKITSGVGFASVTGDTSPRSGINKYKITLNNNRVWTLYVTIPSGQSLTLAKKDGNTIVASNSVNGAVFQIVASDSSVFDSAAGAYPTRASLSGSVSGTTGTYSITYSITGSSNSGKTALFALPHHVSSFTSDLSSAKTNVTLDTTTKGTATAYITNKFSFSITVPSNVGLDPFSTISGVSLSYSSNVLSQIKTAAQSEVQNDVATESNIDSMYTSGKILAKYAWILYVTHYVLKDDTLTNTLLPKLKTAIERFSNNKQPFPLSYDQTWKGVLSTAKGEADYGNSYYNDHHFHYGYHVIASAIVGKVDAALGGSWLSGVKNWVNDLVRDIATPSDDDQYFPAFRSFDWFNGHSWAKGVYSSGDGKDQESTSEDYNAYYALKIWGSVIGDTSLEQRSALQLGVLNGTLNKYFLLADNNTTQPSNFIANKVTGILFENKIDHTTYFGTNLEYIQMIHAIPITSISSFFRSPEFTKEEWNEKLKAIVDNVNDGWKGLIYLNVALFDPDTSWNFFSGSSFQNSYLDNGQSKTWSLTYSGAFANA